MSWTSFKEMMCQLKIILVALSNQQVSTTIGKKVLVYVDGFSLEIRTFVSSCFSPLGEGGATGKKVENETTNVYLSPFFLSVYKETEL